MTDQPFTFDRTVRLCITVLVIIGLYYCTKSLSTVLLPFVVAWFIAYLIHPVVRFFQIRCRVKSHTASVFIALFAIALVLAGILAILIPMIGKEVTKMTHLVAGYMNGLYQANWLSEDWQAYLRDWIDRANVDEVVKHINFSSLTESVSSYISEFVGGSMSVISSVLVFFMVLLYTVFILIDYDSIADGFLGLIPVKYRQTVAMIAGDLEKGMNKYFRGQAMIASTVGVLFSIGFSIMGLPLAVVVGLLIGLFNMVPYLQALGIPITMFLGILQAADTGTSYWIILLEIAAVFVVVQTIQDTLLNPLIMGKTIGMNPAVMLLSLSIWGYLLGIAGMIIALPMTTVIISYYKRFVLEENDNQPVEVKEEVKDEAKEKPKLSSK